MNKEPIQKEDVKTATEMMVKDMTKEEKLESLFQYEDSSGNCSCNKYDVEKFIKQSLQEQKQSILEEIEKKILELIAYSSFDVSNCGYVSERNCTVEEAMSQLSKDVERLLKDNKE